MVIALGILGEVAIILLGPDWQPALQKIRASAANPKGTPWEADADVGIQLAAWINIALLFLLAATTRWWASNAGVAKEIAPQPVQPPRWFWPAVLVAVLAAAVLRVPLASKSLWWDECWVMRQCSHGTWKPDRQQPEQWRFSPTTWKRCAFYYQKPTNHVPMSLLQKASLTAWRGIRGSSPDAFAELAARLPALGASLVAIAMAGCLLRRWGMPGAGVAAAWLLALHPWHLRYGVDARAYALVVPLCVAALLWITWIVQTRGQRWWPWLALALNQFLWLWAYPNAIVDVALLALATAFLLHRATSGRERIIGWLRLGLSHLFAAMLGLQMFLPNLLQARHWAGQEADAHVLDAPLLWSTLSQLMTGTVMAWPVAQTGGAGLPSMLTTGAAAWLPGLNPTWLVLTVLILVIAGLVAATGRRDASSGAIGGLCLLVVTVLLSGGLYAGITWLAGTYFYPRFVIAMLPAAILLVSLTAHLIWHEAKSPATRPLLLAGMALAGGIILPPALAQTRLLMQRPIEPLADVAEFVRLHAGADASPALVAGYGHGREALRVYVPHLIELESAAEIEALAARAQQENRRLIVVVGHPAFNRERLPEGFRLLDDRTRFEQISRFAGIEPDLVCDVYAPLQSAR